MECSGRRNVISKSVTVLTVNSVRLKLKSQIKPAFPRSVVNKGKH